MNKSSPYINKGILLAKGMHSRNNIFMISLWIIALITPRGKAAFYARQLNIMNL